jgi:hypothetical protein
VQVPVLLQLKLSTQVPLLRVAELKQDVQTEGLLSTQVAHGRIQLGTQVPAVLGVYPGMHVWQLPLLHWRQLSGH